LVVEPCGELGGVNMKKFVLFLLAIIALGGAIAFPEPAAAVVKGWGLVVGSGEEP
jgi:hypothetical protein